MSIGGYLTAVICIHDPLRSEVKTVIQPLHQLGVSKIVMMTGDSRRTAVAVPHRWVWTKSMLRYWEDKAAFIRREKEAGRKVIMIGDGVNDSPALSEADAGIAIATGAAIAREIADITIASQNLHTLVTLRLLSNTLMARIRWNYRVIVGFNSTLIGLGSVGLLPPTTSALLHNVSTLLIDMKGMTNLLPEEIR